MCQIDKLKLHVRKCNSQKQDIGIVWKGETIWICNKCWAKIAEKNWKCGKDKPMTWKQMEKRRRKEIREATPTKHISHKKSPRTKKKRRRRK